MSNVTQNQINNAINVLKVDILSKQGIVESTNIEDFLNGFGQLEDLCEVTGIKIFDKMGEVKIFQILVDGLKMHGIMIIEMHLPDGDKFEIVTRYNEQQQKIYTFGYQL